MEATLDNVTELKVQRQFDNLWEGWITGLDQQGRVLVDFPSNTNGPRLARCTSTAKEQLSRSKLTDTAVLLAIDTRGVEAPIIIDTLSSFVREPNQDADAKTQTQEQPEVTLDGERLELTAQKEIVLRVGKACITLDEHGKVTIQGAYVLNRSSGVNRILGGSVMIN